LYDNYLLTVGGIRCLLLHGEEKVLPYFSLSEFLRTHCHEDLKSRAGNVVERETVIPLIFFRTNKCTLAYFPVEEIVSSLCAYLSFPRVSN